MYNLLTFDLWPEGFPFAMCLIIFIFLKRISMSRSTFVFFYSLAMGPYGTGKRFGLEYIINGTNSWIFQEDGPLETQGTRGDWEHYLLGLYACDVPHTSSTHALLSFLEANTTTRVTWKDLRDGQWEVCPYHGWVVAIVSLVVGKRSRWGICGRVVGMSACILEATFLCSDMQKCVAILSSNLSENARISNQIVWPHQEPTTQAMSVSEEIGCRDSTASHTIRQWWIG